MARKQVTYPAVTRPVTPPGQEAETLYTAAFNQSMPPQGQYLRRSCSTQFRAAVASFNAIALPGPEVFMAPLDQSMPPQGDYFRLARSRWLAAALPKVFAPITPPGQEAEVVYLPAHWQQEAFRPPHFKARREKQFIATVAQAGWFHGSFVFDAFTTFGVQRNLARPGVPVYFEVTLKTSSGLIAAHARLYSITGMAVVASSDITTTSTSAARVRSTSLTLDAAATEYRVEFGGQAGMGATFTIYTADLIFGG